MSFFVGYIVVAVWLERRWRIDPSAVRLAIRVRLWLVYAAAFLTLSTFAAVVNGWAVNCACGAAAAYVRSALYRWWLRPEASRA